MRKIAIVGLVLFLVVGMVSAATPAPNTQNINVNICKDFNANGQCIVAQPDDDAYFIFHVVFVERVFDVNGNQKSVTTKEVGFYTVSQNSQFYFEEIYGPPATKQHQEWCIPFTQICLVNTQIEDSYHIGYNYVPPGYCPESPNGQDIHSHGSSMDVFFFAHNGECNIGWAESPCHPNKCYIQIQ